MKNRFKELKSKLESDIGLRLSSSGHAGFNYPENKEILSWGDDAVKILLEDLRENGGNWLWFVNLSVLTKQSPFPVEHHGHLNLIKDDWLIWGEKKGYL